jgi:hypothetical protein
MSDDPQPKTPPLDSPAIRHPPTAALVQRYRRKGRWFILIGSWLLVGFVLAANLVESRGDQLLETGRRTDGVVVEVRRRFLGRVRIDSLLVEFPVDSERRRAVVHLDDSSPQYREGQHVRIVYDPADPARLRTERDINQSPLTVWPMIFALIGGVFLIAVGITMTLRGRRFRLTLSANVWRSNHYRLIQRPRAKPLLELWMPDGRRLGVFGLSSASPRTVGRLDRLFPGVIWAAGDPLGRLVLTLPGPDVLFEARAPRNERIRRRWEGTAGANVGTRGT